MALRRREHLFVIKKTDPCRDLRGPCMSLDPAALPYTPRRRVCECRDCASLPREQAPAPSLLEGFKNMHSFGSLFFFFLNGRRMTKFI